jgi:hypothetical protein
VPEGLGQTASLEARTFAAKLRARFPIEIAFNVVALTALCAVALSTTSVDPAATVSASVAPEFAALEDEVALHPENELAVESLAKLYLERNEGGLAARVLARVPHIEAKPRLLHRLAEAYARMGRIDDGLGTARLARRLCERPRAIGAPSADESCSARLFVAIETQERALNLAVRWGVSDPQDTRIGAAYRLVRLKARVAQNR